MTYLEAFKRLDLKSQASILVTYHFDWGEIESWYTTLDGEAFLDWKTAVQHSYKILKGLPRPISTFTVNRLAEVLVNAGRYTEELLPCYQLVDNSNVIGHRRAITRTVKLLQSEYDPNSETYWW